MAQCTLQNQGFSYVETYNKTKTGRSNHLAGYGVFKIPKAIGIVPYLLI